MRTRIVKQALVILAAAALPAAGLAFEWTASAGLLYTRSDLWPGGGVHTREPHLDIDLKLDAAGFFDRPGIVDWAGGVGYRRISDKLNGATTSLSDALTYHLELDLLQNQVSPLGARLYAQQVDTRVDRFEETTAGGDRKLQRLGGLVRLTPPGLPHVDVGYERYRQDEDLALLGTHASTDHIVTGSLRHSTPTFSLGAQYRGDFSSGNWVADQYDGYYLVAQAQSLLGAAQDGRRLTVSERYYKRTPTTDAAGAFSVNANTFGAIYQAGLKPGEVTIVQYQSAHGLNAAGAAANESSANTLRGEHDFPVDGPEFFVKGILVGSLLQQRANATELRTSGETAGAQLWWRRLTDGVTYELAGGPLLGLVQQPAKGTEVGYGASALARGTRPWRDYQVGINYTLDWGSNLYATTGWSIDQRLTASIAGAAGPGRFDATAGATARRAWSPVFGDNATRGLQFTANYAVDRHVLFAQGSLQSGMTGATPGEFVGDGLFVPAPFDSRTWSLLAGGTTRLFTGLSARAQVRYASTHSPGQPDLTFTEGIASLVYRYAAFSFSLEDRYVVTETGPMRSAQNAIMLNVSRAFGTRF
ncbi:MAG TPA: hypothetical protein VLT61_01585 [Anaeromyxobacteraceae bacterium]|nr:hypothetical protein [Anaeromyxobacteraceae bacterium]